MRGIISAARLRARTGARPGRDRQDVRLAAAARAPARSRPTTRTPPRWGSRRPGSRCAAAPDGAAPGALWFSTADPAYLDKNNATRSTPRCGSTRDVPALDFGGALRSGVGALRAALDGNGRVLVVAVRHPHRPADERRRGRRAATARPRCSSATTPTARSSPSTSAPARATEEFIDRWRTPGRPPLHAWEERFGEMKYAPLGEQAWNAALKAAELSRRPGRPARSSPASHARAVTAASRASSARRQAAIVDDLAATVGNTGTAQAGAPARRRARDGRARPGDRARRARRRRRRAAVPHHRRASPSYRPARPGRRRRSPAAAPTRLRQVPLVARHGHARAAPPARARPHLGVGRRAAARTGSTAFVGSRDRESGALHLPPARVSLRRRRGRRHGAGADGRRRRARSSPFTIDRLAYSPSPPIVFAVVDFDGGGRLPGRAHRRRRRRRRRSATGSR